MNNATLQIGSWAGNRILIEPNNIIANSGLEYPRLIIPLKLTLRPIKESNGKIYRYVILNVQASLYLENGIKKISDSLQSAFVYNVIAANNDITCNLEFPLDYKRIIKIEEHRRNNLAIQLQIHFTIGILEQNYQDNITTSSVQIGVEIEQSHWVTKILPQLSFGEFFLVEIPKGKKYLEEAWAYIEKADDCYKMWDTKGTFANCREVGVLLNNVIKEKLGNHPNFEKWQRSFNYLTSLYLHIENPKGSNIDEKIYVNKSDAEHILILAKAFVKYAEGLLRENVKNT